MQNQKLESMVPPSSRGKDRGEAFLEVAKQIEQQGVELYNRLAAEIRIRDISGIFKFLAREEQRHYNIFDAWQKNSRLPEVPVTEVVSKARDAFQKIVEKFRETGLPTSYPVLNYSDAYEKALAIEKQSIALYEEQLPLLGEGPETARQRTVLSRILAQERGHAELITALLEMNRYPGEWLENAEFYHLDEY